MEVAVGVVCFAAGGVAGWWLAREVARGMPWGVLVAVLAVLVMAVATPFLWPTLVPDLVVTALRTLAGGVALVASLTAWSENDASGPATDARDES